MRVEPAVREEIRLLVERGRTALGLEPDQVIGCAESEIQEILGVQEIPSLPASLDELLRISGGDDDEMLGGLFPGTCFDRWCMINDGKRIAAKTAGYNKSGEVFGPDRVVFRTHPNGDVFWMELGDIDPPIFVMTEYEHSVRVLFPRLACKLEQNVIRVEFEAAGRTDRVLAG